MSLLVSTFANIHKYLESGQANHDQLVELLSPLNDYLEKSYPYHVFVKDDQPGSWLVTIIATYLIDDKRTAVELVSYTDHGITRFLRSPSCIKTDVPSRLIGQVEERVSDYLSERHVLDISGYDHPQRLLYLCEKIKTSSSGPLAELMTLLEDITLHLPYRQPELTFTLDEILLILDTGRNQDLKWICQIESRIRYLANLINYPIDKRRLIRICLLVVIPALKEISTYLVKSFERLLDQLGLLSGLTQDFLLSLLDEIKASLASSSSQKSKKWEKALSVFFKTHRDECFTQPFYETMIASGVTSSSSREIGITST